jgi:hypothetical protein
MISTSSIATDIKEVKKKTLESLWKMLKKAAFTFKSVDFEVCKILTSRTTYQICITNNKDKTRRILGVKDDKEIVLELSKIFDIKTFLECTIDSGYLTDTDIDFNVFPEAIMTCHRNMGRKIPEEFLIDLKNYSGELNGIYDQYQFRNSDNLSTLKITLPLDIKYIIENYSLTFALNLAFIMGSHERLGARSFISLLDSDTLFFILL